MVPWKNAKRSETGADEYRHEPYRYLIETLYEPYI